LEGDIASTLSELRRVCERIDEIDAHFAASALLGRFLFRRLHYDLVGDPGLIDHLPGHTHPVADFDRLMLELERFDSELPKRPMLVAVSKCDLPEARAAYEEVRRALEPRGLQVFAISSATGEGVTPLLEALETILRRPADV